MIFFGLIYLHIVLGVKKTCTRDYPAGFCFNMADVSYAAFKLQPAVPAKYYVQKPAIVVMNSEISTFDCDKNNIQGNGGSKVLNLCCTYNMLTRFNGTPSYNTLIPSFYGIAYKDQIAKMCLTPPT